MTTADKIKLYRNVADMNGEKELIGEMIGESKGNGEMIYSLGVLEYQDVSDDIYHNGWNNHD